VESTYFIGLDLGQINDFSALAVLERTYRATGEIPERMQAHYACRLLRRFALGTPYPVIVDRLRSLTKQAPLRNGTLVVDQTGVGRAVVDMLREARLPVWVRPITITGGHAITSSDDGLHVPKRELVSSLQVLLQNRRLQVAPVPERALLLQELLTFKVKITAAANEVFESMRERDHDDLVIAVALAAWLGEQGGPVSYPTEQARARPPSLWERMQSGESNASRRGLFGLRR
jgi:hypothetical protein